ncbi:hypothetical protein sphantq_02487 [Sphingobium sp. AntQ-1]|uniref:hypothetical protein n=1 Tax=Sphingobium sp. AntQ-1 TaxID=2930091 RepID=UPI00234F4F09|nr:hypothetical protein [Sphingobium sp. AntQ-1]WCP14045.1 hypothetical protein sphantq_02487 [Sphingobium sp. AntQ-1]
MTIKKPALPSIPRADRKSKRRPIRRPVASNVIYLDTYLKATRDLCDAQRFRHVVINDAAQAIGTLVSRAEFDEFVQAELNLMID